MKTIADLGDLRGKRVLVRSDLNVPLDGDRITDDGRVRASVPTITELTDQGARVVVVAHLGRPKGAPEDKYSLKPVVARLGELLGQDVAFATDTVGESAKATVEGLQDGQVALLENLRFNPGETSKDESERQAFAKELASLADAYVSDGFGVVHRKQASVYDIAKLLPAAAGTLVKKEGDVFSKVLSDPDRPFTVVLGGAKVADKLAVIDNLLKIADTVIVGGGMAYTFLKAQGHEVGTSLLDEDSIEACKGYLEQAKAAGKTLLLPVDVRVATGMDFGARTVEGEVDVVTADAIPADKMGLDIGPETEKLFAEAIKSAKTVVWNGPMGVFEIKELSQGTAAVARALTEVDGLSVVGGGDSAAAVRELGHADEEFGHISTGGGASLEYLEGKELPGLTVLEGNN